MKELDVDVSIAVGSDVEGTNSVNEAEAAAAIEPKHIVLINEIVAKLDQLELVRCRRIADLSYCERPVRTEK
jgi:hypothetical protein